MERIAVDSSAIASIGYEPRSRTLEIEFTGGRVYQYFDVPVRQHRNLMRAESKGAFFNDAIRFMYPYAPISRRRAR